jgi:peptide/nickel transport system permease protein
MHAAYVARRIGLALVALIVLSTFLCVLPRLLPGDPVVTMLGARASPELVDQVRREMKLGQPIAIQLWAFFSDALRGDLGTDFTTRLPVSTMIGRALPQTVLLAGSSMLLAVLFGIPLGIVAATRAHTWADGLIGACSVALITVPSYVAALVLLLIFAIVLRVLPAIGTGTPSEPLDYLLRLILPSLSLSFAWIGYFGRLVRTSLLEVLGANYVRTARAFGLTERTVLSRYALPNALIPTIALVGFGLGNLLGSAVFIEIIFARPGLGMLVFEAVQDRNYPVLRSGVLTIGIFYVLATFLADIVQHKIDPRLAAAA